MARRRQAVTIRHVAAEAGVSLQTVSRVINKEGNVRPELIARVQEAIGKLDYVPSIAAQRMSGSRSYLIVALNDRDRTIADWRKREGSDWVDQMLLGGMLTCAEHGYRLMVELVDTHSSQIERELAAMIAALQPDGVILTPPHSQNPLILRQLETHGIGCARIGSLRDGPGFMLTMGDEGAARLATNHLIDLGHRRIALIAGSDEYELSGWRVSGWQAAMAGAGLDTQGLLEIGDFGFESGRKAAEVLLTGAGPPSAIIAANDQMAIATLEAARALGLDVPDDLSIVSFDDTPVVRFVRPPLTAIVQPIAAVTARAVELLLSAVDSGDQNKRAVDLAATLVVRESTAPPRE